MAKVDVDLMDVHENSLDNSADSEYCGMVDEGSFESSECESSQIVSNTYLDGSEDTTSSYSFKDLSGAVTYKLVQLKDNEVKNMTSHSPSHDMPSGEFYVISHSEDIFPSSNSQKKVIRRQPLQPKAVTAKKRDDKRRATHNEVERRRRDKINTWITNLAALVPNSGLPDSASKGGILAKACEYITELTDKQKKLEKLEVDNDKLVLEILRLNQELTEVRKENSAMHVQIAEMHMQLTDKCNSLSNTRPKGEKS